MFRFFIVGFNAGLGRAIVNRLSGSDEYSVIGRENGFANKTVDFQQLDLSKMDEVHAFAFSGISQTKTNVLINNAGNLGEITGFTNLDPQAISDIININLTSPLILMNKFLKENIANGSYGVVVNITSRILKLLLEDIALYAVSKSALSDVSELVGKKPVNGEATRYSVIAIDPGMIDTGMQSRLRNAPLPLADFFKERYVKPGLNSPDLVGSKIIDFVKSEKWESGKSYHFSDL